MSAPLFRVLPPPVEPSINRILLRAGRASSDLTAGRTGARLLRAARATLVLLRHLNQSLKCIKRVLLGDDQRTRDLRRGQPMVTIGRSFLGCPFSILVGRFRIA